MEYSSENEESTCVNMNIYHKYNYKVIKKITVLFHPYKMKNMQKKIIFCINIYTYVIFKMENS